MYLTRIFTTILVVSMIAPINIALVFAEPLEKSDKKEQQQIVQNLEKTLQQKMQNHDKQVSKQFITSPPSLVNNLSIKTQKSSIVNFDTSLFPKLDVKIIPNLLLSFFQNGIQSLGVYLTDFFYKMASDQNNIFPNAYAIDTTPPTISITSPISTVNNVTSTVSVGTQPFAAALNPSTGAIYIGNYGSNSVSVIDGTTNSVTSTISVGTNPQGVAVNPYENIIYVTNSGSDTVSVINGTTNTVIGSPISVGSAPVGVALDPSTNTIYVANYNSNSVSVINGTTNSVTSTISVGTNPHSVTINPSTHVVYVTNSGSNTVSVINGTTNTVTTTVSVGLVPRGIAFNSFTSTVYAVNYNSNTVSVINGTTYTIIGSPITVGTNPYAVAANPSTNTIYVANAISNTVSIINGATNVITNTTSVGTSPYAVTANPSNSVIYVANKLSNSVSVINGVVNDVSRNGITVTGKASDTGSGVSHISWKVDSGSVSTATGTTSWHFTTLSLSTGSHTVLINATDVAGNVAKTFQRVTVNPVSLTLTDSIGMTDQLSYVFTSTSTVGNGGTAKTPLPGGTAASITLPSGQSGTVTIQTTTAPTTGSSGSTLGFVGTVIDIVPPTNACAVLGCVFSFNFTSAQVTAAGLADSSQVKILHDHNNDGDFDDPGETLSTTIATVSPGHFTATATDFFTSKFAIGGVVTALALLGAHGGSSGSSQAFNAQGFLSLKSLSQSAKDAIQNEDPYTPLKPSIDPTVPYYPFSLGGNNYLIARYANTIQTVTEKVGTPVDLQLASSDKTISHVALYTNMEGLSKEIGDSDTYIIYDKGSPLQIVDPHGFFSNVKITTTTDGDIGKFGFSITFANPMHTSNIFIREWNEEKYSSDTKIKDAIEIVESPQNTQTSNDIIPDKTVSTTVSPVQSTGTDDIINYIKQWGGYSSTSISDSQLLDHMGIKGNHIPPWFMQTSKNLVNGDTSQQEFKQAIQYMSERGFIK